MISFHGERDTVEVGVEMVQSENNAEKLLFASSVVLLCWGELLGDIAHREEAIGMTLEQYSAIRILGSIALKDGFFTGVENLEERG